MKKGILRTLDHLGRIVIPIEYRNLLGIENEKLEIFLQDDCIILKKPQENCVFCKSTENLTDFKDKKICEKCLDELKAD